MTALVEALAEAVGAAHVDGAEGGAAPGGVRVRVRPASAADVARVLAVAGAHGCVVRVGAGEPAGVDGGARRSAGGELPRGEVTLDGARLASVLELDETSLLAHVQAGMTVGALEAALGARGLTLGALPPSTHARTVGAVLAAPRPSEATPRGRLVDACMALEAVLADGTVIATRAAPRKATGPELSHALLGARGRTGVIVAAWLRVARRPPVERVLGFAGGDLVGLGRRLLDAGLRPADLHLVRDAASASRPDGERRLHLVLDGVEEMVDAGEALAVRLAAALGARRDDDPARAFLAAPPERPPTAGDRFVRMRDLPAAYASDSPRWVTAFRPAGAVFLDAARASVAAEPTSAATVDPRAAVAPDSSSPAAGSLGALRDALARALDPAHRLAPTERERP